MAAPVFKRVIERLAALPDSPLRPVRDVFDTPALAGEEQPIDQSQAVVLSAPDLRGMSASAAVNCGRLRGLTVHVSGSWELVVDQVPLPGDRTSGSDGAVYCQLGSPEDVALSTALPMPLRQAVLLRKLRRPMLAALH